MTVGADVRAFAMLPVDDIRRMTGCPELLAAVEVLYAELARRMASERPLCRNRGACCRFESWGHRLYVTPLELAYFETRHPGAIEHTPVRGAPRRPAPLTVLPATVSGNCPFQEHGLCTTRAGRPVGCRVFFCESQSQSWQGELSEWALRRLKELHDRFNLPYVYSEWLQALDELRASKPSCPGIQH